MKTSELTGAALDWAVARCLYPEWWDGMYEMDGTYRDLLMDDGEYFNPSTNWAQGGEIIERECICIFTTMGVHWWAKIDDNGIEFQADDPLTAAMRCYVASELGDEVDVPEELTNENK
jgi:hypothetical protein